MLLSDDGCLLSSISGRVIASKPDDKLLHLHDHHIHSIHIYIVYLGYVMLLIGFSYYVCYKVS